MRLSQIAAHLGGRLEGPDLEVRRLAGPERAKPGELVVVREPRWLEAALASGAALLMGEDASGSLPQQPQDRSVIFVPQAEKAWPRLLALFERSPRWAERGIHPSATVEPGAQVHPSAAIGAYALIRSGAHIGAGAVVAPYAYVGEGVEVGEGTVLEPRVTLYPYSVVGPGCWIGTGAVLGVVGFGFQDGVRLPHTGRVVLEEGVELGAGSIVQRSVVGETRIGAYSKIGELVLIGHNVQTGQGVVMVGLSAVGGSVRIEDRVVMAGQVVLADHVRVGQGARIAGSSAVSKDIPPGQTWAGGIPARPIREHWRRLALLDWLVSVEKKIRRLIGKD
jgi:UDP-3-O-[3-hydroxymyristoyl] glucosamine N-acyltransferase